MKDAHGEDEEQRHRRQHRPLRQRDRHGRRLMAATKRDQHQAAGRQVRLPRTARRDHPRGGPPAQPRLRDGPPVVRHVVVVHQPDARAARALEGARARGATGARGLTLFLPLPGREVRGKVYILPKKLDEKVARLHLDNRRSVRLCDALRRQADSARAGRAARTSRARDIALRLAEAKAERESSEIGVAEALAQTHEARSSSRSCRAPRAFGGRAARRSALRPGRGSMHARRCIVAWNGRGFAGRQVIAPLVCGYTHRWRLHNATTNAPRPTRRPRAPHDERAPGSSASPARSRARTNTDDEEAGYLVEIWLKFEWTCTGQRRTPQRVDHEEQPERR